MKWVNYLMYDETSPSGLRWVVDSMCGKGHGVYNARSGDVAGNCGGSSGRWQVSVSSKLYLCHRIVWEIFHGCIPKGFVVDHYDRNHLNNKVENLRLVHQSINMRNRKKSANNTTGVNGVQVFVNSNGNNYFVATWCDINKNPKSKYFSRTKLGDSEAFRLACDHRNKMIDELNTAGLGYTEQHGK